MRTLVPLIVLAALAACEQPTKVQSRYVSAQDDCRDTAESYVAKLPNAAKLTPDQRTAETINQFSDCMNKAGWPVTNPLKAKAAKAAAAAAAAGATAPTAKQPAPATPTAPAPHAPATYQPYTPSGTTTESAPGRQF